MGKQVKRDWVSKLKAERNRNAKKTVAYLNQPGGRVRFDFGPGADTQPVAPPFERSGAAIELLSGNMTQGNWLDQVFMPAFNNYNAAFAAWEDSVERTKAKVLTLRTAENIFIPLYRKLYAIIKGHPAVTDTYLAEMMFPVLQNTRTPAPVPESYPVPEVSHPAPDVVAIGYRDSVTKKAGKPGGVHGVEVIWALLDVAPLSDEWDKLTHSSFDTASPFTLSFTASGGKNLYFALRWENTRGEKGPWCSIQHTIIS